MIVRGLIISAPRRVSGQTLSVPDANSSEVVVRVEYCGLCTPEQRVYRGTRATYPYWGGHELAGIVESAPASGGLNAGDRVAVLLMQRCGQCPACRRGLDNHCAYLHPESRPGLPLGPGGLVDRIAVPVYKAFAVPPTVPALMAAMTEPLACVMRSIDRARPKSADAVAVLGGGTMGLLHTAVLTDLGCRVFQFDDDISVQVSAGVAGAVCCEPLEALSDAGWVSEVTGGWGFEVVVCTRFGIRGIDLAVAAAARGGRIVLYQSIPTAATLQLSTDALHYRELALVGTIAQSRADVYKAIGFLTRHHRLLEILKTETIPASRPEEAFEMAIRPHINRVLIDFRSSGRD